MRPLISFLPILLLLCWGCRKECRDADFGGAYQFVIPATLSPAKDTFRIGDTIHISSVFSDEVYERQTEAFYKLENWRFYPTTRMDRIDKVDPNFIQDGLADFDYIIPAEFDYSRFDYGSGSIGLLGEYLYKDNEYSLEFKLIPHQLGLYYFTQFAAQGIEERQDFPGRCPSKISETNVELNGGIDNNIDFLQNSPDIYYNERVLARPQDNFHNNGGYCFYVIE
jgi:hypothetical protein